MLQAPRYLNPALYLPTKHVFIAFTARFCSTLQSTASKQKQGCGAGTGTPELAIFGGARAGSAFKI